MSQEITEHLCGENVELHHLVAEKSGSENIKILHCCLLSVVYRSVAGRQLNIVIHCLLFVVCCRFSVACSLLNVVVHCLLSVVCCLLPDVSLFSVQTWKDKMQPQ